jgi:hypothetical protein
MKIERLFSAEYPPDFTTPLFSCLTKPTIVETYFGAWVGLLPFCDVVHKQGSILPVKTVVYRKDGPNLSSLSSGVISTGDPLG